MKWNELAFSVLERNCQRLIADSDSTHNGRTPSLQGKKINESLYGFLLSLSEEATHDDLKQAEQSRVLVLSNRRLSLCEVSISSIQIRFSGLFLAYSSN